MRYDIPFLDHYFYCYQKNTDYFISKKQKIKNAKNVIFLKGFFA